MTTDAALSITTAGGNDVITMQQADLTTADTIAAGAGTADELVIKGVAALLERGSGTARCRLHKRERCRETYIGRCGCTHPYVE